MERYKYYFTKNTIVCVSHYAGKAVRGVAKCAPSDTYNQEFGMKLARLRCDCKVAELRFRRASKLYDDATEQLYLADQLMNKRTSYICDAQASLEEACDALAEFMSDAEII